MARWIHIEDPGRYVNVTMIAAHADLYQTPLLFAVQLLRASAESPTKVSVAKRVSQEMGVTWMQLRIKVVSPSGNGNGSVGKH